MSLPLALRVAPDDSIVRFDEASAARLLESQHLLEDRAFRTGCAYLAGYVVETTVKAAILELVGLAPNEELRAGLAKFGWSRTSIQSFLTHDVVRLGAFWQDVYRAKYGRAHPDEVVVLDDLRRVTELWNYGLRYRSGATSHRRAREVFGMAQRIHALRATLV